MQTENPSQIKISFFVPCYNEERNVVTALELIRNAAKALHFTYEVLVIDDGSTDSTSAVVQSYSKQHPEVSLQLFRNEVNKGLGYNYIKTAGMAKGEFYMAVYGDHCVPIEETLEKMGQADMVIPYFENLFARHWVRRLISKLYVTIVNLFSGNNLKYYNGTVIHRREKLLQCRNVGSGFGYQAEILCKLIGGGASYVEVPFRADQAKKEGSTAFTLSNFLSVAGSLCRILITRMIRNFTKKGR